MRESFRFPKPYIYFRYVDDTFVCFSSRNEALLFFHSLNDVHPALTFTMEEEKDNKLPFLDVLVDGCLSAFFTCIYRKPTFIMLYRSWDAFAPKYRKVPQIKCLTFRALKICTDSKIKSEFEQIKNLLLSNGYPKEVIADTINSTVNKFRNDNRPFSPSECPVYVVWHPWIGSASQLIADKVTSSVACYYNAVKVRTIFTNRTAFQSTHKVVFPIFQQSNLINKFQCCCDATYIGHASQCLEVRVRQHIPQWICDRITSGHSQMLDSAICEHLNAINTFVANYHDECFAVLHRTRTKQYLNVIEAVYILFNHPYLCKQNPRHSLHLLGDVSGVT